ncbi:MAG: penicillin-binding transpeptidase domain-containing protein [bacterium]|nr:penicillin-binding transpeptidase domain-containing protein [bacterium]
MGLFRRARRDHEIAPDEIFLDSSNLPGHNVIQFEGRVVQSLSNRAILAVGLVFCLVALAFAFRAFSLEVIDGSSYADISRNNTLDRTLVFATRGLILDRNGKELAWNEVESGTAASSSPFALRKYTTLPGFAHVLGFIQYPKADSKGNWWREEFIGKSGVELAFNDVLRGINGSSMVETDARKSVQRENIVAPPQHGTDLKLSVDADIQTALHRILSEKARTQGYRGGAAVIMNAQTGEVIALTSFPEYNNQAFSDGSTDAVRAALSNARTPMLDRAIGGVYAPGSIMKLIFASGALNEGLISPEKKILSKGALILPNPYDPAHPSVFKDWTTHGWVDMREAIAVSSDEYFYVVGGGYGDQKGLGISKLDEYARRFGLGSTTGFVLSGEADGIIPTPAWKAKVFPNDPTWRTGDTYHTSIGQYGFQITPLQAVRYVAAIGNGGKLLLPQLTASSTPQWSDIGIPDEHLQVVREGMRLAVTSNRRDSTLNLYQIPGIVLAGKSGTAQLGANNEWVNSWNIGYWPSENPKYAFAVVFEQAPSVSAVGAGHAVRAFFEWLVATHPEYAN